MIERIKREQRKKERKQRKERCDRVKEHLAHGQTERERRGGRLFSPISSPIGFIK